MTEKTAKKKLEEAQKELEEISESIVEQIKNGEIPEVKTPTKTKSNIVKDDKVFRFGQKKSTSKSNDSKGMKKFLRLSYLVNFLHNQLEENRSSTLREIYYLSESWENNYAQFDSQDQSDRTVENIELMTGMMREDYNLRPEEDGATIIGPLKVKEQTKRGTRQLHCQEDIGEGGYQIPTNPDEVEFIENNADFILAVETGGMRDRLVENGFDEDYNAIITHLKGQPARATRRIIKRMNNEMDLPVLTFADGDPWSYRIFGSLSYGSIKSAHLSKYLATPEARYIGITPEDIVEYDLPTDPLSDSDINALENELEDPRFNTKFWKKQIELQLDINKKSEQQSLASQGLDFVTEEYLPEKINEIDEI